MDTYHQLVEDVRKLFKTHKTRSIQWRKDQLKNLIRMLEVERETLAEALNKDLNKCRFEALGTEVDLVRNDAVSALNHLDEWTQPAKVKKNLLTMMDTCFIKPEPFGVVLVIGAWNYPVQLSLLPVVGAISAGNACVLKPSEVSPHTAEILSKLLPQYLDKEAIKVVNGGVEETTALLKEHFDLIFYTGNSFVGKIVMKAASQYLTPVVLELGGKSPVYVDKTSDLQIAANRIAWGKFMNTGQTCIAPDYVLCEPEIRDQLVESLGNSIKKFYSDNPQKSNDLCRIVNHRHFERVKSLMKSGQVVVGGRTDPDDKYIEPTVVVDVDESDPIMQEEVFGPVLPIMTVGGLDQAIDFINAREKPLALYMFSKDKGAIHKMINETTSGTTCFNDTVMQGALESLPFGGVGNSGMGAYHGKFSFDAFSHQRGVMIKEQKMESANSLRYPPFSEKKLEWLSWIMRKNPKKSGIAGMFPFVLFGVLLAFLFKLCGRS